MTGAARGGAPSRLRRLALPAALAALSAASAAAGFSVGSLWAGWALVALSLACACAFVLTARRGRRARRAALGLVAAAAALAAYLSTAPVDPSDLPRSMGTERGVRLGSGAQGSGGGSAGVGEAWYDSPDEAVWASLGKYEFLSEPLAEKEDDEFLSQVFFLDLGEEHGGILQFAVETMRKSEGKFSLPVPYKRYAHVDLNMYSAYHNHDFSDEAVAVAQYLNECFFASLVADGTGEDRFFKCFGVSRDPRIGELSILGERPDGVVEYGYGGQKYYFWYYHDPDFRRVLAEDPGFDFGGYTLAQVVEALEIEVPE
ncbi:hypothetical protein B5F40_03720 [Gordonibacter sp. An230]|uniref:hypothetical protein n=1 Tax=Gordonibacter sp. An230 TaxID=1965592 RepID=UPI000B371695|nr:hypothetical protein [Gordonibacter sp. An230]OUO91550.1 hypothetical protein B5F40_03720 [Gordonibacter sp. An230]